MEVSAMAKKDVVSDVLETVEHVAEVVATTVPVPEVKTIALALEHVAEIIDLCRHVRSQGGDPGKLAEQVMSRLGY
jgi:hypothetical protein